MIVGECPYEECSETHMIPISPRPPQFTAEQCEGCKKEFWMFHSRIHPTAYTLEAFDKYYIADHEKMKIIDRATGKGPEFPRGVDDE